MAKPHPKTSKPKNKVTADSESMERHFQGASHLEDLLAQAGSVVDAETVAEGFKQAQKDGVLPSDVIPGLFDGEPRFASPAQARALYGNLLGLWDLVAEGAPLDFSLPVQKPKRVKPVYAEAPGKYEGAGPDAEYVEAAWKYLEQARPKERTSLWHAFNSRQDALLGWLDDSGLSDEAFAVAHQLLFELFAMLELGRAKPVRSVKVESLTRTPTLPEGTEAMWTYVEEVLFLARHDEEAPLSEDESRNVEERVRSGLTALWQAQ